LTAGNVGDAKAAPGLLADETSPVEVLADSAYGSGHFRAHLADHGHTATIKPIPQRSAIADGLTTDDFTIDLTAMTATCPNGITVTISPTSRQARFRRHCDGCPLRARCTRAATGKVLTVHVHHDLLAAARADALTPAFSEPYRQHRPMVERSIAWLTRRGGRKVRYRGIGHPPLGRTPDTGWEAWEGVHPSWEIHAGVGRRSSNGTRWRWCGRRAVRSVRWPVSSAAASRRWAIG
jgi:hypothetical protein